MRILHCIPSMEGGGAERQLTYLARALGAAGCDVHVALNHGGPNLAALRDTGATIHQIGLSGNHDVRMVNRLLRVIQSVRPDLLQCWLTQMQIAGGIAALIARTPWVFAERASASAYPPTFKNLIRSRMGSAATAIVSNSAAGDCYWQGRAAGRVHRYVIPNALPIEAIAATAAATSQEAGVAPGEALVLFAGRLDAGKNAETLVHALSRARTAGRIRAILCGDGPMRGRLEQLIVEHDLAPAVRMAGYVPNLWSLMKRASALVAPSRFEGNPNVVLEAMACGCPLVVSDIPAHREILDQQSAIFVDTDDADGIARGVEAVIADPTAASRRAERARQRAERHAVPGIAQQYVDVYREVLSRHRRRLPAA